MRPLLLAISILLLASCAPQPATQTGGPASASSAASATSLSSSSAMPDQAEGWVTYTNESEGWSIQHPAAWTVEEHAQTTAPGAGQTGTVFVVDPHQPGTTLSQVEVQVSSAAACPRDPSETPPSAATLGGTSFERSTWNGVGAGNLYEGTTYRLHRDNVCYALTLFIHSCNLGPDCGAGHDQPYDRAPLEALFDQAVATFTLL